MFETFWKLTDNVGRESIESFVQKKVNSICHRNSVREDNLASFSGHRKSSCQIQENKRYFCGKVEPLKAEVNFL
jgi:hypothetical protein